MPSLRSQIADAIISRLNLVLDLKSRSFDKIRLLEFDFDEWELPACQIIDGPESNIHEMKRGRKSWNLILEVVIGPKESTQYNPTQKDLWDLMETIEKTIMQPPTQLNLDFVIGIKLLGSQTDQGLLQPYYTGRINFNIDYYQPLIGECN